MLSHSQPHVGEIHCPVYVSYTPVKLEDHLEIPLPTHKSGSNFLKGWMENHLELSYLAGRMVHTHLCGPTEKQRQLSTRGAALSVYSCLVHESPGWETAPVAIRR